MSFQIYTGCFFSFPEALVSSVASIITACALQHAGIISGICYLIVIAWWLKSMNLWKHWRQAAARGLASKFQLEIVFSCWYTSAILLKACLHSNMSSSEAGRKKFTGQKFHSKQWSVGVSNESFVGWRLRFDNMGLLCSFASLKWSDNSEIPLRNSGSSWGCEPQAPMGVCRMPRRWVFVGCPGDMWFLQDDHYWPLGTKSPTGTIQQLHWYDALLFNANSSDKSSFVWVVELLWVRKFRQTKTRELALFGW